MPYNTGNPELDKWLEEKVDQALSPEERSVFQSALGKQAVSEQIKRAWMAPPDYNRKMNELTDKEKQLEQELQNHLSTLSNWQTTEQAKINQAHAKYQQAEAELAALRQQIQAEGLQPATPAPAAAPASNGKPSQYMTKEEAAQWLNTELSKAAMLPALTAQIVERHRQMFGSTPDMTKVTDTALRTGRTIMDVWQETYKVADKERELQQADIQKKIDEGVAARMAQLQADGTMGQQNFSRPSDPQSPIRRMIEAQRQAAANSPLAVPAPTLQVSDAVRDAEEAHRSGRYAVKFPGQP